MPSPSPSTTPGPAAFFELETAVGPSSGSGPVDSTGFEPIVATHPTDPQRMAVAYQRYGGGGAACGLLAGLRISHDGGRTWQEATAHPWDHTGRGPSFHSAIAWGPGPAPGTARLYWIDTTVPGCDYSRHQVTIAWSDDEGGSWSRLQVQTATPAWIGGFPDIAADRDPRSPGFGSVFAVYNWSGASAHGPGLRLLASRDFGRSWTAVEIASAPSPAGYPVAWRIGYRVSPASDGAYVSWFQEDLRRWDAADFFDRGGVGNVGRAGFVVVHVSLDRGSGRLLADAPVVATTVVRNGYDVSGWTAPGTSSHSYPDPSWSHGLAVDPTSGRVYLAVGEWPSAGGGSARGAIRVGTSDDQGKTWRWVTVPELPIVAGRPASPFRPALAVCDGIVFVGSHWISDAVGGRGLPAIGAGYAVSVDGGATFVAAAIPAATWPASALASALNGPGLRDRAAVTADGRFVYAYGDGRRAAAAGSSAGPSTLLLSVVSVRTGVQATRSR